MPHSHSQTHTHNANNGHSAKPAVGGGARGRGHRHTASIASLIRGEERGPEDGWSPVAASFGFNTNGNSGVGGGRTRTD